MLGNLRQLFRGKTEAGVKRTRETWFSKVAGLFQRSTVDEALWEELEELLIGADVGVSTTAKLLQRVKERARAERLQEPPALRAALQEEMVRLLAVDSAPKAEGQSLHTILVVGVNGAGKTTSIAKLAHSLQGQGEKVLLAAADTFRAAAIDQIRVWGDRLGIEVIAHQPGGDPGAVVFDALQAASHRGTQTVIVDTAGRLHTKSNLMEELKKIQRVVARFPTSQQVLLVLDATTGQNGLLQARAFTEAVGVEGIFIAKLDGTAKGGIVLAICDQIQIPVLFIGTGETLEDIAPFNPQDFVAALLG
ncbi:MAG: signal recognition particle-docking protein FtsY [Chloroflexota bacterium]|nr:signal recognition particle-docking protein FtsY [Chloroflexota bacterium]